MELANDERPDFRCPVADVVPIPVAQRKLSSIDTAVGSCTVGTSLVLG